MRRTISFFLGGVLLALGIAVGLAVGVPTQVFSETDVQQIDAPIGTFSYPQITVEAGKPVRINFTADSATLNGCNDEIIIPEWNIQQPLSVGDNFVEFTPEKSGTFFYTCWMGMIRSSITVVEQGTDIAQAVSLPEQANLSGGCVMMTGQSGSIRGGGCCSGY